MFKMLFRIKSYWIINESMSSLFLLCLISLQCLSSRLHRYTINAHMHSGLLGTTLNFPVHCLPLLLGDENKVSLLGLGALEPLCQLISHDNKLVRRSALMALGIMTANSESDNIGNQCRLAFSVIWWRTMQPSDWSFVDFQTEWWVVVNAVSCFH